MSLFDNHMMYLGQETSRPWISEGGKDMHVESSLWKLLRKWMQQASSGTERPRPSFTGRTWQHPFLESYNCKQNKCWTADISSCTVFQQGHFPCVWNDFRASQSQHCREVEQDLAPPGQFTSDSRRWSLHGVHVAFNCLGGLNWRHCQWRFDVSLLYSPGQGSCVKQRRGWDDVHALSNTWPSHSEVRPLHKQNTVSMHSSIWQGEHLDKASTLGKTFENFSCNGSIVGNGTHPLHF